VATNVKVLLKSEVVNLGSGGEIVKVRAGYARNFLLPRGLALPATDNNLKKVEELKREAADRAKAERDAAQGVAQKLGAVSVTIKRAVGGEGKMYGSVTTKDIAEAFAAAGVTFDRKVLVLPEPIKTLGSFEVIAKLHSDVQVPLKVEVVKS